MQRTLFLALTIALAFGVVACKKKATTGEAPVDAAAAKKAVTVDDVAEALSKAVCDRMVACEANAGLSAADCAAGLRKDLQSLPEDKATQLNQASLGKCVASITKATCEALNSPNPPEGCEFME